MSESDAVCPDDVPVDAVEQQRPTAHVRPDEDRDGGVPLETTASDWQELIERSAAQKISGSRHPLPRRVTMPSFSFPRREPIHQVPR